MMPLFLSSVMVVLRAVAVRTDYTAGEVRRLAKRAKDAAQARRLLAIAAVLDGASRTDAATVGGMDRQTLRDWVIRFNNQGPDGLINIPSPGVPPKLDSPALAQHGHHLPGRWPLRLPRHRAQPGSALELRHPRHG